jgi:hypothetical protein
MDDIVNNLTNETIKLIYTECKKRKNKKKIKYITNLFTSTIFGYIQPYLYTILAILIIMFFMNVFQFVYYIKYNTKLNKIDALTNMDMSK